MRLQAIHKTHPLVVTTNNNEKEAFDKDGKKVTLDEALISVEIDKLNIPKARELKKQELSNAFINESLSPVEVNDIFYNGGFDSAIKLDAAKRLNETAGLTEVTFYDIDNKPNIKSIGDATVIIMTIANKYQVDLAKYQDLKVQLAGKKLVSTIEALSW